MCVSGDSFLLKVWSYEEISITSSYGDPMFYIKSNDSSYLKSLISLLFGSQYGLAEPFRRRSASWNSQYLYDVSKNEDHSVDIILSPYGQSCILLANPYDTSEVPMRISVSVERSRFECSVLHRVFPPVSIAHCHQRGDIRVRKRIRHLRLHSFLVSVSLPSSTTSFS